MGLSEKHYVEDTAAYLNEQRKRRILFELYAKAYLIIKSVYIFKNFNEYIGQLRDEIEKNDVYWNASYYEKLIDYIKISVAFETYNKAVLLENGFIIHLIKKNSSNSKLFIDQKNGIPIHLENFIKTSSEAENEDGIYLSGFRENFQTINYSATLSENYQKIIQLDNQFCFTLKEINEKRNRLHFFTEFKGAFEHESHIRNWRYIMETSINIIETKYRNYKEWP